jgi:hypothetical protein
VPPRFRLQNSGVRNSRLPFLQARDQVDNAGTCHASVKASLGVRILCCHMQLVLRQLGKMAVELGDFASQEKCGEAVMKCPDLKV